MKFTLKIMGTASAMPISDRNPSAQVLCAEGRFFLIDCGEGTQQQLRRAGVSFLKIEAVFITHIHGDHMFGLFGLLGSMALYGRTADLYVYGPQALGSVLKFYDNEEVVLEEAAFSLARQAIEGSFGASGLEIPEAYAVYERSGVSQDELVERILSGESTPSELSIEAIRMMKAEAEASAADGPDILACLFIALLVIAVLLAVLVVIILIRMRRPRS